MEYDFFGPALLLAMLPVLTVVGDAFLLGDQLVMAYDFLAPPDTLPLLPAPVDWNVLRSLLVAGAATEAGESGAGEAVGATAVVVDDAPKPPLPDMLARYELLLPTASVLTLVKGVQLDME